MVAAEEELTAAAEVTGEGQAAVVVFGAGWDDANGLYAPVGKIWHGAPVFENDRKCLLSREPHKSRKTGQTSYGWILGKGRQPLYAAQSEQPVPPREGWRRFGGAAPPPQVQSFEDFAEAALALAEVWKEQGNKCFAAGHYEEAVQTWTRASRLVEPLGESLPIAVALFSNRAEARLRQQRWALALGDAEEALRHRPWHDKALLRAAVAARELQRFEAALEYVRRCLEAHPHLAEAHELAQDLERRTEELRASETPQVAQAAQAKLRAALAPEGSRAATGGRQLRAFGGYGEEREQWAASAEPAPLAELPYHKLQLPPEQIELMDKFFADLRAQKAERQRRQREEREEYQRVKDKWRERAEDGEASGRLEQLAKHPSPKMPPEEAAPPRRRLAGAAQAIVELPKGDMDEIDGLFADLDTAAAAETVAVGEQADDRWAYARAAGQRPDGRTDLEGGAGRQRPDGRTALERALDGEEAAEREAAARQVLAELRRLSTSRGGEPSKFEQAVGEVYASWSLPAQLSARDVRVAASKDGSHLTISVRGISLFDRRLFLPVHADDVVWTIGDGELHLTLSKRERGSFWEQLGDVAEVQVTTRGEVVPESLPEPLSGWDRVSRFRQMLGGDDGHEPGYDDLPAESKRLVEAMRRYEHARAIGDEGAMSLAEADLEEFGKMVI